MSCEKFTLFIPNQAMEYNLVGIFQHVNCKVIPQTTDVDSFNDALFLV